MDAAIIEGAGRLVRSWRGEDSGEIRVGSKAHRHLYCRMLFDTFNPCKLAYNARLLRRKMATRLIRFARRTFLKRQQSST